jgi:hypothetical protein
MNHMPLCLPGLGGKSREEQVTATLNRFFRKEQPQDPDGLLSANHFRQLTAAEACPVSKPVTKTTHAKREVNEGGKNPC